MNLLGQSKISNFDLTIVKKDISRFEIVMNDRFGLVVQIAQALYDLGNNNSDLFQRKRSILLEKVIKITTFAVIEDSAETVRIDFKDVKKLHDSRM